MEMEELQNAKRKLDKEMEALQDRIDELTAENSKIAKSKKKVQEEVSWINKIWNVQTLAAAISVCSWMTLW